mgnify:CR=1 FL=1
MSALALVFLVLPFGGLLFGIDWGERVDDLPEERLADYAMGAAISAPDDYYSRSRIEATPQSELATATIEISGEVETTGEYPAQCLPRAPWDSDTMAVILRSEFEGYRIEVQTEGHGNGETTLQELGVHLRLPDGNILFGRWNEEAAITTTDSTAEVEVVFEEDQTFGEVRLRADFQC